MMKLSTNQKNIVEIENKNMLVSASAGSGKTFVVIQRILNKIINQIESIDKLLVVTFTNAAAYELKERLTKGLYDYLDTLEVNNKEKRAYILKQINKIPISHISTIHSFCISVIKDNFFLLGTNPVINIIDEANSKLLILESIIEVLENEYEIASDEFMDMLVLFKSEENIITILEEIYKFYQTMPNGNQWLEKAQEIYNINKQQVKDLSDIQVGQNLLNIVKEKIIMMCLELDRIMNKIDDIPEFKSRWELLNNIKKTLENVINISKYNEMYEYLLNIDLSTRLPSTKVSSDELKKEVMEVKKIVTKQVKEVAKIIYKDTLGTISDLNQMYPLIKHLSTMVNKIDEKYTDKKNKKQVIDFSDIEHLALKALQDEKVCKMYKEKFNEIYIDEYQDTSLIQEEIINKIKRNNNIVRVGDVKQSIYGFRNAKPELFIQKYLSFSSNVKDNDIKIILDKNFRSRKEIIDSTNYIFERAMTSKCGGIDYTKEESLKCGLEDTPSDETSYLTEINIIETKVSDIKLKDDYDEALNDEIDIIQEMKDIELQTKFVIDKIIDMTDKNSSLTVYDSNIKKYRKCMYKDIVILLRSTNLKSEVIENEFKNRNIPVYLDSNTGFFKSEEINLIINMFKLINNRYDDISLASVMYSIIGSFTLDELTLIRIENKQVYLIDAIYNYIEKGDDKNLVLKLQQFVEFLDKYTKYINIYSLAEITIKLYEETLLYNAMLLEDDSDIKQANLDAFVDIVSNFEKREISSLVVFLNYIENLSKKGGSSDSPKTIGENENVVRIMTIHKSKGLEFPIVIIMNTNQEYNTKDTKALVQKDENFGIGINILNKEYNVSYPSTIKQVIKSKITTDLISEELRLLYVALTRAKDKLLIYGAIPNYEKFYNKIISNKESIRLSDTIVNSCNSYLKLILEVLNLNSEYTPFKINIIDAEHVVKNIKEMNESYSLKRGQSIADRINKLIDKDSIKIDEKYLKLLQEKFNIKYVYEKDLNVQQKYTATELKQLAENKTNVSLDSILDLKPSILETTISATSYGTLIHKIIENIDLEMLNKEQITQSVEQQLQKIQSRQFINKQNIVNKINIMLNNINYLLNGAKEINKEYEFVINDDLKEINKLELNQKTLIQGVIDLYIITKDNKHIIIDYKTDKIDSIQELIDRYKYQLYIYKRAIEISHKTNVDGIYIYSFYLDKLIEIK